MVYFFAGLWLGVKTFLFEMVFFRVPTKVFVSLYCFVYSKMLDWLICSPSCLNQLEWVRYNVYTTALYVTRRLKEANANSDYYFVNFVQDGCFIEKDFTKIFSISPGTPSSKAHPLFSIKINFSKIRQPHTCSPVIKTLGCATTLCTQEFTREVWFVHQMKKKRWE